ncbi:MAG: efflux RND transporter permease subunit [Spirochaetaceae bacterium]
MDKGLFSRHRGILIVAVAGVVAGLFLLAQIPVTLYPNTTKARIAVGLSYPGYTPQDFREQYGEQIESRLSSLEGVEQVEGRYQTNRVFYTVEFDWETDSEEARRDVEGAMSETRSILPSELDDYWVSTFGSEETGYLAVASHSSELSSQELYELIEPVLAPRLSAVEDAESADIIRVTELRASIEFEPQALAAQGLHLSDVIRAVESGHQAIPLGSIREEGESVNVRITRGVPTIYDVGKIPVSSDAESAIVVDDVADVSINLELPRRLFRANGERAVLLVVTPRQGGNVNQMVDDVREVMEEASFPEHVSFEFLIDPSEFIDNAIRGVIQSAILGALFALLAIVIFLGEARNVFVIFLSIPLSIVLSFILMYLFDISINLISLGGMTLSVGMIIDATVVVMENIHRHRRESRPRSTAEYRVVINTAVREVRGAITGAVITSVLVFLPLSFTSPLTNAILGNLARTVIFALLWSLAVALTVVPVAAYYLFRGELGKEESGAGSAVLRLSERTLGAIRGLYLRVLSWLLGRARRVWAFLLLSLAALAALAYFVLPGIPQEILATPEADRVQLFLRNSESADQEEMLYVSEPLVEQIRTEFPESIRNTFTQVFGENRAVLIITATSPKEAEDIASYMQENFQSDDVWQFEVSSWDPAQLPLPRSYALEIRVQGPDPVTSAQLAEDAAAHLREAEIYPNIFTRPGGGETTELILTPRRQVLDGFEGLSLDRLSSSARIALSGGRSIEMPHQGRDVEIEMFLSRDELERLGGIENMLVPYRGGAIPLRHFFDSREERGLEEIATVDGELQFQIVGFQWRSSPTLEMASLGEEAMAILDERMELPDGYTLLAQDTQKEVTAAIESLILALLASVILIFLALGVQFNSIRIPLVILVTIPLGFIGVIGSLHLMDSTISLNSMLGTILLGGIVVNNAILLIDFYFQHRSGFETTREALMHAARLRFAPILITMATTVLGMVPIALALTEGTKVLQPLGIAVAGGLLVSTLFTLFMIPGILMLMHPEKVPEGGYHR